MFNSLHSLLSGGYDGTIGIHDLENFTGEIKHTCKSVSTVDCTNRHAHKKSVETVHWYPLDTGMFTSSGTDNLLKVWDTNNLVVCNIPITCLPRAVTFVLIQIFVLIFLFLQIMTHTKLSMNKYDTYQTKHEQVWHIPN